MASGTGNLIPKLELLTYRAELKGQIFRAIRKALRLRLSQNFSQADMARRLKMDPGLLSRRLNGEYDMRLETFSDLARGLDCRIDISVTPFEQIKAETNVRSELRQLPARIEIDKRPVKEPLKSTEDNFGIQLGVVFVPLPPSSGRRIPA